jgi:acetate---CoA ligase (ADP-forming)
LLHKTDVGAVELHLSGEDDVEAAAERMADRVKQAGHELRGFMVQQMAPSGVEMLVGVVHDPLFGPVVACGAGGVQAELLKDVAVRITPLTDRDARQMITSLRTFPLLDGFRGAPKADLGALEDVILRVGALVENHPEIAEMDCNPVIVSPHGALIADARIRVEEVAPPRPQSALTV